MSMTGHRQQLTAASGQAEEMKNGMIFMLTLPEIMGTTLMLRVEVIFHRPSRPAAPNK